MIDSEKVLEANIEYHNRQALFYQYSTGTGHSTRPERMFKRYGKKNKVLLDVGCGQGEHMELAKKYFGKVYGIDCSEGMIAEMERNGRDTSNVVIGDAQHLPYEDESFDMINCFSVLHHCFNLEQLLSELHRVLKPGGMLYTDNDSNKNFYRIWNWWLKLRRKFFRKKQAFLSEYDSELERIAEYHQSTGIDINYIEGIIKVLGFQDWVVEQYFPSNPDRFTKILMWLSYYKSFDCFYYYFSVLARKED